MTYRDTTTQSKRSAPATTCVEALAAALMSVCPRQTAAQREHERKEAANARRRAARRVA